MAYLMVHDDVFGNQSSTTAFFIVLKENEKAF